MIKIKNNNMLSQFYYLKKFFFIYNLNFIMKRFIKIKVIFYFLNFNVKYN